MFDHYQYWTHPPPEPSPGLVKFMQKWRNGWRPNRRIRAMGYDECAEFLKVYIWEYLNVILPMMADDMNAG